MTEKEYLCCHEIRALRNFTKVQNDRPHGGGDAAPRSWNATCLQPSLHTVWPVWMHAAADTCGKPRPAVNT